MKIVSNSTPLINLSKIKCFNLLESLYKKIYIPPEVYNEIVERGKGRYGSKEVKEAPWVIVKEVKNKLAVELLLSELDKGEAETIVLAQEIKADLVLIDQPKPRKIAKFGKLKVKGTLGILFDAKRKGLIKNLKHLLDELKIKRTWIDDRIYQEILRKCKEI